MPEVTQPTPSARRTILYEGRVQGVGFRFTTCRVAARFRVCGYVRNLHDGRVELVAEGEPAELDRFARAVDEAMQGCIRSRVTQDSPATGEFDGFGIQR